MDGSVVISLYRYFLNADEFIGGRFFYLKAKFDCLSNSFH